MKPFIHLLTSLVKLAIAGATIAAIAFAVAIYYPDGSVGQADADVFWLGPASLQDSKQQRFVDFLDDQGFSEPQPYSYNGNTLFFSHQQTDDSPRDAVSQLQKALVEADINQYSYPRPPDPSVLQNHDPNDTHIPVEDQQRVAYSAMGASDFFSGGLVPTKDTGDHIALTGVELLTQEKGATDLHETLMSIWNADTDNPTSLFNNFRSMEVFRPQGSSTTQMIAIFGDGDVDFHKFAPGGGAYSATAPQLRDIPPCPGCERNNEFAGLQDQADYATVTYNTRSSMSDVVAFYERAMPIRGWNRALGLDIVHAIRASNNPGFDDPVLGVDMLTYSRAGQTVHIHIEPASGPGTLVNIFSGQ